MRALLITAHRPSRGATVAQGHALDHREATAFVEGQISLFTASMPERIMPLAVIERPGGNQIATAIP